jgi:hypothetical protein
VVKINFMKSKRTWQLIAAFLIAICYLPIASFAQSAKGFRYDNVATLDSGRPVQGASILVCKPGTSCATNASIFTDQALSSAITQPGFQSGAQGNYFFYAACGTYDIQISGNGLTTRTMKDVQLGACTSTGFIQSGNTARVATDFTTAANTSLQTIAGLTWTVPAVASSYSFHCGITYSQATAAALVSFGIQAATNAPTNIFANGAQSITVGPPATEVNGNLLALTTTTATTIVSGTPGAIANNYVVTLEGTIENPAVVNTFNIMVSTATAADAVTVRRGSYCQLL